MWDGMVMGTLYSGWTKVKKDHDKHRGDRSRDVSSSELRS